MSDAAKGVDCGVVAWVKQGTLRWHGYLRMYEDDCKKSVWE